MQVTIGLEAINNYKRLSYTTWFALSEFVDNSTQAYFDNRETLNAAFAKEDNNKLTVAILYDREKETITITDTSIGMDEKELEDALQIASRPPREGGRGKYGMGMKTAACWFGDRWTIKTKKLGSGKEFAVTFDVPTVAASGNLAIIPNDAIPESHGTVITISNLHRKIQGGRAIANIKEYLRSIYRYDIKDGFLELLFQGEPLTWEGFESRILRDSENNPYLRNLDFTVLGKRITGWVGVLESGGRPLAGFSLIQNKRVVTGYPEGWRPHSLFGQLQGSNDLVNQRLCGELHVDGFQVNHTKDGISWQDDEEEIIDKELAELCDDYRRVARERRKGPDKRGPSQLAIDNAVDQVRRELTSGEMVDMIQLTEIPAESVLKQTSAQIVQHAAKGDPRIDAQVGDMRVRFYINEHASAQDPYYALDLKPDGTIMIAINQNHDYMVQLGDDIADFIRQCVYDGIAEFKAVQKRGKVEPHTIRFLKDNLLRVPFKIHDDVPAED